MTNYSAAFKAAMVHLLQDEGGYVHNPKDPGGETKFGITKRSYPNLAISQITVEQATAIYHKDFWLPGPFEKMTFAPLADKVFNTGVNMGNKRAFKMLQQAANALGAKLSVDGAIGPLTIAAINKMNGQALLERFRIEQRDYYLNLITKKPSLKVFQKGWLARAAR